MAKAIVTVKIMPTSPEEDMDRISSEAQKKIVEFAGEGDFKKEIEPIAFGLKAAMLTFVMDESLGGPEPVEKEIASIEGVNSVEVVDVRRAIG